MDNMTIRSIVPDKCGTIIHVWKDGVDNHLISVETRLTEMENVLRVLDAIDFESDLEVIRTDIIAINEDITIINNKDDEQDGILINLITAVNEKANKTYVDGLVKTPVPEGAVFTDTQVDISGKADKTYVDSELDKKADITYVDTEIANIPEVDISGKADKTYVDSELDKKADMSDIPDISGKADITYVDNKVKTDVPANAVFTDTPTDISDKVDKVTGKGLSTNDYTNTDKTKLGNLPKIWIGEEADKGTATDTLYFCYE